MSESFAELFEQSLASGSIKSGTILTGTVIEISPEVVIVSAGLKSEAVIPASEFRDENGELECAVGDEVEVAGFELIKLTSIPSSLNDRAACDPE